MRDGIIDRSGGLGGSIVRRYLQDHPHLAEALARGARPAIVVFALPHGAPLFDALQQALDEAVAAEPDARLFVALTTLPDVVDTGAFRLGHRGVPWVRPTEPRFLGSIALGEGGVTFVDAGGTNRVPTADEVLAALAR